MNPNACLSRIMLALLNADREDFADGLEDLAEWTRKGGFLPTCWPVQSQPFEKETI